MDESSQPVQAQITPDTEIRKLRPSELNKIAWHLTTLDSWKRLMLDSSCEEENLFNLDQVRCIEQESKLKQISAAEIFLNEWSTWGKKRPTCQQLMSMCIKMQNYRAADYLADILKTNKPPRPETGPAAPVDMTEFEEKLKLMKLINDQQKLPTSHVEKSPKNNNEITTEQSLAIVKSIFNFQQATPKPKGLKLTNKPEEKKPRIVKPKVHEVFPEPDDEEVEGIKYLLEQPILTDLIKLSNVNLSAADNLKGNMVMIPSLSDFMKFSNLPMNIPQNLENDFSKRPAVASITPKKEMSTADTNIQTPSSPEDDSSIIRSIIDILELPEEVLNEVDTRDIPLFVLEEEKEEPKDVPGGTLQVLTPEQRNAAKEYNELFDPDVPLSLIEERWRSANVASESLIQKTIERLQDCREADKFEQEMLSVRKEHNRKISEKNALKSNALKENEKLNPDNNSLSQEEEKELSDIKVRTRGRRLREEFFKSLLSNKSTNKMSMFSYVSPDLINQILDSVDNETKKLSINHEKNLIKQDKKNQKQEFFKSPILDESKDTCIKSNNFSPFSYIPLDGEQRTLDSNEREMKEPSQKKSRENHSHRTNGYTSPSSSPSTDRPNEMFILEKMLAKSISFQKKMAHEKQIMAEALNSHGSNASSISAQSPSPPRQNYKEKNAGEFPLCVIDEAKEVSIFSDALSPNPHHYLATQNKKDNKDIIDEIDGISLKESSKSKNVQSISEFKMDPDPDLLPDLSADTSDISRVDIPNITIQGPTSSESEFPLSSVSCDVTHSPSKHSKEVAETILHNQNHSSEEIDEEFLPVIIQNFNKNILRK
ncbi:hypothetical protein TKK_0006185 [Trichogramma kaykai]|uniref:Tube Death domain-containing protein n=1 Tax=Trichogramma kaykai TaxID=54128 RepID=A0ABD2XGA6_9HYME